MVEIEEEREREIAGKLKVYLTWRERQIERGRSSFWRRIRDYYCDVKLELGFKGLGSDPQNQGLQAQ